MNSVGAVGSETSITLRGVNELGLDVLHRYNKSLSLSTKTLCAVVQNSI